MAYRLVGAASGEPWLLLHGGPGGACHPGLLQPLDLSRQRAIAPDQRGCGASRPRGCTQGNHTAALVADLEALRQHLGLERWSLLAGSWGTVVALAYARQHPKRVQRVVLRAAFALSRREIAGLVMPSRRVQGRLGSEALWPSAAGAAVSAVLARLRHLLQSGTTGVAAVRVARRWQLLESAGAAAGMRRALRHLAATPGSGPALAAARREWTALQRRQRRAVARARRPAVHRADRAALRACRIQCHYLLHRGFVPPGGLDHAVRVLARAGVPVDWVHGRFDAICPPRNSRRWAAVGARERALVTLTEPFSGHLGHEPAMLAALRQRVRGARS
jgi:proline iminopeptidase